MTTSPLKAEYDYYLANKAEMVKKYNGKFIVIKGGRVLGAYDDAGSAVTVTQKTEALGTFLVQEVEPGDSVTQSFHSRVAFARVS